MVAQYHDPDLDWFTLKSEHFLVHYPAGYDSLAGEVLNISESIYHPVSRSLGHYPGKTHVILHARTDVSNGFTSPLPWRMELYLVPPQENWMGSGTSWLKTLIIHEFTHIVHLRKTAGLTALTAPFFGELNAFWQGITPQWFLEGLPTLNETRYSEGGRGRNPYHWMQMMAPIQYGNPWSLANTNYLSRKRRPVGMQYIAGYFLADRVREEYGEYAWEEILERYTAFPVPGFNRAFRSVTGVSPTSEYRSLLAEFRSHTPSESLITASAHRWHKPGRPENQFAPQWDGNSSLLVYRTSFDDLPAIVRFKRNGETTRIVRRSLKNSEQPFAVNGENIVWSETFTDARYSATNMSDLVLYSVEDRTRSRLTRNKRLVSPDFSPDGARIVCVRTTPSSSRLVTVSTDSGDVSTVLHLDGHRFYNPDWSPDGERIVFGIQTPDGKRDLAVLHLQDTTWNYLQSEDTHHDNTPCWGRNGEMVFYESDRTGIFNIWALHLPTGRRWQVTDDSLGAFMPAISPDGTTLAFSRYSYTGFTVTTIPLDSSEWHPFPVTRSGQNPLLYSAESDFTVPVDRYATTDVSKEPARPLLHTLIPQGWIPLVWNEGEDVQAGIYMLSEGPLRRHSWDGLGGVSVVEGEPSLELTYQYSRWWPEITLRGYSTVSGTTGPLDETKWNRRSGGAFRMDFPLTLQRNVFTSMVRPYWLVEGFTEHETDPGLPGTEGYRGMAIGADVVHGTRTLRDIVMRRGVRASVFYAVGLPALGSDFNSVEVRMTADWYLPLPINHHQVQLRMRGHHRENLPFYTYAGTLPAGYEDDQSSWQIGAAAYYHFPVSYMEWKIPWIPVYLDYLAGNGFIEWGSGAASPDIEVFEQQGRYSTGGSLYFLTHFFHALPVRLGVRMYYVSARDTWEGTPIISISLPTGINTGGRGDDQLFHRFGIQW